MLRTVLAAGTVRWALSRKSTLARRAALETGAFPCRARSFLHNSAAMQQPSKLPNLKKTLEQSPEQLEDALSEVHPEDIAAVLAEELPLDQAAEVVQRLPVEQAAEVLERLPEEVRVNLLAKLKPETSAEMVTEMAADDRADLMNELPGPLRESILSELQRYEPEVAAETRVLASYGEDTAAGIMTTEYIALGPGMSCDKAIAEVRRIAREQEPEL